MYTSPFRKTIPGLGVRRGRLPGARHAGWRGSVHDCEPRDEGTRPMPGTSGIALDSSLGVAENALPCRSITHTYEVSAGGAGSPRVGNGRSKRVGAQPEIDPASGMPG